MLFFLTACLNEPPVEQRDQFQKEHSLRITTPANGAVVDSSFIVGFEAGSKIDQIRVEANGVVVKRFTDMRDGEFELQLSEGTQTVKFFALDAQEKVLDRRALSLIVDPKEYFVSITSPTDGSTVSNPVQFVINASSELSSIELYDDNKLLGVAQTDVPFTHSFEDLGYPREITAIGIIDDEDVAEHTIWLTVEQGSAPLSSSFNAKVLDLISTYPTDGSFGYYWPNSGGWLGTTQDIYYLESLVAEGDLFNRSYCVGLTWEVFMRAWELEAAERDLANINGMDLDDLTEFRIDWYVRDLYGSGVVEAVENYGIGEHISDWSDIEPGDFLQFWRNNGSGHNNIFIDWEKDSDGNIIGVEYWSTQGSTDGIGYNSEYFGAAEGNIDPAFFFAARVYESSNWTSAQE